MKFTMLLNVFIVSALILLSAGVSHANATNSPDSWSNGITDAALENLPDECSPYTIQCGPFKNRETARPYIYKLVGEIGIPGYFQLMRGAKESVKDNQVMVRAGKFSSEEEAKEKIALLTQNYPNLCVILAYSGNDNLENIAMLDFLYDEFDEGSRYTGRLAISCTPEVPGSVKNFVNYSSDNNEVKIPIHVSRISSNAVSAIKRIKNQQHQLIKDIEVSFDEQFGCYIISIKMKRKIEVSKISQYAPIIAIDFEKMPN